MNEDLKTNHNIRIVTLSTAERVLCMFGEVKNDEEKVVGYRLVYPYLLGLGELNEDGTIPINYSRWCPYSPIEDHRISGDHIISVVYPDNNILGNYAERLKEIGLKEEQIFYEEKTDGDSSESTATE
jgi:hypothetical protein|tara:strand:+ start:1124 stop:1504 length:381 start_codon:yes stop_codon:yes gene_type:complete